MKKLLTLLGVTLIGVSSSSVTACSASYYKKELIKNKLNNLVGISSALLRGAMVQNASQEVNGYDCQVYDANFLHDLVNSKAAHDEIDNIKVNKNDTIAILKRDYFNNQNLYRDAINELNQNAAINREEEKFLSDNVKSPSPNKNIESIVSIISLVLNGIKSEGGINPPILGLLQGVLGKLPVDENMAKDFSSEKLKSISESLKKDGGILSNFLQQINDSNLIKVLFSTFLNIDFLNIINSKDNNKIWSSILNGIKQIDLKKIEELINSILTNDKVENMTNKQVMNATVRRIGKIIATLINFNLEDNNDLYKDVDFKFEENLGTMLRLLIDDQTKLNVFNILQLIPDILFVISGILHRTTIFDFSQSAPKSNDYLFKSTLKNSDAIKEIGNNKFNESPFKINIFLNNLMLAFNSNGNGLQLARLIAILFESGSPIKLKFKGAASLASVITILKNLNGSENPLTEDGNGDFKGHEGVSPILTSLGWVVFKFIEESIPSAIKGLIGPHTIGNAFKAIIDMFVDGRSIEDLDKIANVILKLLKITEIKFSPESKKIMKNSWDAIWKKESGFLKELLKTQENISLETLLNQKIVLGMTLYELINSLYENINSSFVSRRYIFESNDNKDLINGFNDLANSLIEENFKLWKTNKDGKDELYRPSWSKTDKYNAVQVFLLTVKNNDLFIEINDEQKRDWKGSKAAIAALGATFDQDGSLNREKFRDNSIFSAIKKIYDNNIVQSLIKQTIDGINTIEDNKNNLIKYEYENLIDKKNFKSKVISYKGLVNDYDEAEIIYQTEFNFPNTDKIFKYEIKLKLLEDENLENLNWKIYSIKRI